MQTLAPDPHCKVTGGRFAGRADRTGPGLWPAAFVALLLCVAPSHAGEGSRAEYDLVDDCKLLSEYYDFAVWERADSIIVARVSGEAEFSEEKWHEAEFQIEEVLLGDLKKGAKVRIFARLRDGVSKEVRDAVARRAQLHDSPEFIPLRLTRFPLFGHASKAPEPEGECYPVPVVIRNVSYVIMRAGRRVLSVEPVFTPSDYWLRFLKALKYMHYWQRRAIREMDAETAK